MNSILNLIRATPLAYAEELVKAFMISALRTGPIPSHLSFVMDGNRRYAKKLGLPLADGHSAGSNALVEVLQLCFRVGVKQVTVYAFSIENFKRPKAEVDTLFTLLKEKLLLAVTEKQFCESFNCSVRIIGERSMIPADVLKDLEKVEADTAKFTEHTLFFAFPYTSRDDIAHSMRSIVQKVENDELDNFWSY
ncbi:unnamed protein product [Ambrosiozyma monospora]|uniref:Alkyl transferase n=1 Tax=Ambrosiozyma monospora TaxID=43982 RepID=A0A9W6YQD3_AMBMO|nr:unnamed protein product [Ambrosiozyma monospora]